MHMAVTRAKAFMGSDSDEFDGFIKKTQLTKKLEETLVASLGIKRCSGQSWTWPLTCYTMHGNREQLFKHLLSGLKMRHGARFSCMFQ